MAPGAGSTAAGGGGGNQPSPQQINMAQRQAVLRNSVEMTQQVQAISLAGPIIQGNNVLNFTPRFVGLVKRFLLEITGTATANTATSTATVYGLSKLISNLQFIDLNNNVRINTDGMHLTVIKQAKQRELALTSMPASTVQTDAMMAGQFIASGAAPNFPVVNYPLPTVGGLAFRAVFEIPIAYSDDDLRGAIYLNVVNATATLQVTINPNAFSANGATDTTGSVWTSGANPAGTVTNLTATLYQVYLDQLPVGQNGVILPTLDLSTVYELKITNLTGQSVSQDYPYPYANFRDFLSTLVTWNSTGLTAGLKNGSDVNYWALQSANFTNIWKIDPLYAAQKYREIVGTDLPLGTYYFSHRKKPLSTIQYGNLELILNAASLTSGSCYQNVYVEDFALVNALTQAGSLAA
jgi:P3 major capsid protein